MPMYAAEQPVRYGSRRKAKSNALVMVLKVTPWRYEIACFGNDSHYRKEDGICAHVEMLARAIKPWYRQRTWFAPFGESKEHKRIT